MLCLATCMMWVRSHWRFDQFEWVWRTTGINYSCVESAGGHLIYREVWTGAGARFADDGEFYFTPRNRKASDAEAYLNPDYSWRICGITGEGQRKIGSIPSLASNIYSREIVLPYWPIVLVQFAMMLWLGRACRRTRNRDNTHCTMCGYDLRATTYRCPECGAIPTSVGSADLFHCQGTVGCQVSWGVSVARELTFCCRR
jgi:hypothetical protein